MKKDRYSERGISVHKEVVHKATQRVDKGLYPNSFCRIFPDVVGSDPKMTNIIHTDTAGTKPIIAYLYWKETGNLDVWRYIAQDAIVMNIDDMACVGILDDFVLSSTILRNSFRIPNEIIETIIQGTLDFIQLLKELGYHLELGGGETADVNDLIRTIDVGITAFAREFKNFLIITQIQPGDVIVGLASDGQATYETIYNSGIGCNGLTSARHELLEHSYAESYPETYDPDMPSDLVYCGKFKLTDPLPDTPLTIGEALLSPTRTYLPIIDEIVDQFNKRIHGIIHCTGGGQTKVLRFAKGLHVIKNDLFSPPPIFQLLEKETPLEPKELFQTFNMGHRMEIYTDFQTAQRIIPLAHAYQVNAKIIGYIEKHSNPQESKLTIHYKGEAYEWRMQFNE